ncbi:hypothetical protein J6524_02240 [Bradyrhizobium sp. WSM 1738]|uniref:hypothetical protein n=1 Tax=Bradyrhizobium hereditatis TaxID=2821405 RepID=UPI001CE23BA6|nr:hypothetical protein [Bradyrhizobium hereditatis]MCA6113752.1 hypothetical protein [Bradyrhizobium hereditatis]
MAALFAIVAYVDSTYDWESAIGLCHVPVTSVTPNPNAKLSAVVFEVYCGPLPPLNAHVALVPNGRTFSRKRDVDFLVLAGSDSPKVQWTGESTLDIRLPALAKVIKRETQVGHVTVTYTEALWGE